MNLYIIESKGSSLYKLPSGDSPLQSLALKHGGVARFNVAITPEEGLNPVTSLRFGIRRAEGANRLPVLIAEGISSSPNNYDLDVHLNNAALDADFVAALASGKTTLKYEAEFEWMRADADGSACRSSSAIIPILLTHAIIQTGDVATPELSHYPAPEDVATKQYVQDNSAPSEVDGITFAFTDPDGHPRKTRLHQAGSGADLCYYVVGSDNPDDLDGGFFFATVYKGGLNIPTNGHNNKYGADNIQAVNGRIVYTRNFVDNGINTTTISELATLKDISGLASAAGITTAINAHNTSAASHADIRKKLPPTGGTVGQVLTKNSNTEGDTAWMTPSNTANKILPPLILNPSSLQNGELARGEGANIRYLYMPGYTGICIPKGPSNGESIYLNFDPDCLTYNGKKVLMEGSAAGNSSKYHVVKTAVELRQSQAFPTLEVGKFYKLTLESYFTVAGSPKRTSYCPMRVSSSPYFFAALLEIEDSLKVVESTISMLADPFDTDPVRYGRNYIIKNEKASSSLCHSFEQFASANGLSNNAPFATNYGSVAMELIITATSTASQRITRPDHMDLFLNPAQYNNAATPYVRIAITEL